MCFQQIDNDAIIFSLLVLPVCHEGHILCGPPEGLADCGVADDHDNAGDRKCDN